MCSWIAAATSYSTNNVPMIPFYIYYSMFGLQRVGDLAWAAGDMRCRGFLLGGTAGRTTLNGEGLQHEDGHSHVLASTIPNCVSTTRRSRTRSSSSSATACAGCIEEQEDVYYYVTLMNENYRHPAMPAGAEEGIIKGLYLLQDGGKAQAGAARAADGQRHDPARSDRRGRPAARRLRRRRRRLERDELQRAAPRRHERRALEPAASDASRARKSYVETCLEGHAGPGRSPPPTTCATTPTRCAATIPRRYDGARHRRLRPQRLPRQAAPLLRGGPPLRRRGGAEGAGRRRRDRGRSRRRGDREVRPRRRAAGSVDV